MLPGFGNSPPSKRFWVIAPTLTISTSASMAVSIGNPLSWPCGTIGPQNCSGNVGWSMGCAVEPSVSMCLWWGLTQSQRSSGLPVLLHILLRLPGPLHGASKKGVREGLFELMSWCFKPVLGGSPTRCIGVIRIPSCYSVRLWMTGLGRPVVTPHLWWGSIA